MDTAQIILIIVIILLTILLVALGVQVFFILREFRKTVSKANKVLDNTEAITQSVSAPISSLSGIAAGIKTVAPFLNFFKKIISKDDSAKQNGKKKTIKMENNNRPNNNFLSGFLLGAIIGAAIVFLLATKKGKKILKAISEEGEDKISNILNKIENSVDLEGAVLEDDDIETVAPKRRPASPRGEPKAKRFFKGISRHVN